MLGLLLWLSLPLVVPAPLADPLVDGFRKFLESTCSSANGNWTEPYNILDANETLSKDGDGWVYLEQGQLANIQNVSRDGNCTVQVYGNMAKVTASIVFQEMDFAYDFSINSNTIPNASGCVYGLLDRVWGNVVVQADVRYASDVTVALHSLTLHGPGMIEVDKASITNLYGRFSDDVTVAIKNLLAREIFPFLEQLIGLMINNTLTTMSVNINDFLPSNIITEETDTNLLKYSNKVTRAKGSTGKIKMPQMTSTRKLFNYLNSRGQFTSDDQLSNSKVAAENGDISRRLLPRRGVIQINFSPIKDFRSENKHSRTGGVSCTLMSMSANFKNENYDKITHSMRKLSVGYTNISTLDDNDNTLTTNEIPVSKVSMTAGFDNIVDAMLKKTNEQLERQRFKTYRPPDGEEELYQTSDGFVKLVSGRVYGMNTMTLRSDPAVKRNGTKARVSVYIHFNNVTYTLNFSTNSKTFPRVSGTVRGNFTQPSGELIIEANLTDVTAVTATLKGFQMQPNVEYFSMDVYYPGNNTAKLSEEVRDAVITYFEDVVVKRLQDAATGALSIAVASLRVDMSSTLTTSPSFTTTSCSSGCSSPGTTQKPSSSSSFHVVDTLSLLMTVQVAFVISM